MISLSLGLGTMPSGRAAQKQDFSRPVTENRSAPDSKSLKKLLVAINGSEHGLHAVRHVIRLYRQHDASEIHLLNVQDTCESPRVHAYYSRKKLLAFEEAAGDKALLAAQHLLAEAGVNYVSRVETGPIAQTITSYAEAQGCDAIVMGTSGHGAITSLIVGNVSIKVIHLTDIPVTLVK